MTIDSEWIPVTAGLELRDTLSQLEAFERGKVVFQNSDGERASVTIATGESDIDQLFCEYQEGDPVAIGLETAHLT